MLLPRPSLWLLHCPPGSCYEFVAVCLSIPKKVSLMLWIKPACLGSILISHNHVFTSLFFSKVKNRIHIWCTYSTIFEAYLGFLSALHRFLPSLARSALQKNLADSSIEDGTDPVTNLELKQDITCELQYTVHNKHLYLFTRSLVTNSVLSARNGSGYLIIDALCTTKTA